MRRPLAIEAANTIWLKRSAKVKSTQVMVAGFVMQGRQESKRECEEWGRERAS